MKNDIFETVKSCFTRGLVMELSTMVDETELNVRKALNKSVPLTLKGLLNRVESGFTPLALLNLVQTADSAEVLKQLAKPEIAHLSAPGANLLQNMLGSSYRTTVQEIAVEAGIRPTASAALLEVVATAVLGVLGRHAVENEFTPDEFADWLRAQKVAIGPALLKDIMEPELASPLGLSPLADPPRRAVRAAAPALALHAAAPWAKPALEEALAPTGPAWLRWQWGALLLLAVSLGYFFGRGYFAEPEANALLSPEATKSAAPSATLAAGAGAEASMLPEAAATVLPAAAPPPSKPSEEPVAPMKFSVNNALAERRRADTPPPAPNILYPGRYDAAKDRYIYDTGRQLKLTLSEGSSQQVGANSTERRLYSYLASDEQVDSVNRTKGWINLDRVNFDVGKTTLTPESAEQLDNIASILNFYPRSMVKIGGYSDSTGDAELNYRLSDERARVTMLALARRGVDPGRLQSKGYGPRYFVMPNKTPSGRSVNRRVSIRVVEK